MRWARTFVAAVALSAVALGTASGASAATGKLTYKGCITGQIHLLDPCDEIPTIKANGAASGLDGPESVTVSPDGKWVYAVARQDDSIARFKRSRRTGRLTYRACISGDTATGGGTCGQIPTATGGGSGSGLDDVRALVISRDGESAYAVVAGQDDDAVARFTRDPRNGRLTFEDCITGAALSGPGPVGTDACEAIASTSSGGAESGLDHPKSIVLSPDQKSLYVASTFDASVARFKRNTTNGELTYRGCITGEQASGPLGSGACAQAPTATGNPAGRSSGLDDARGLVVSRDGGWLYGVADDDDSIFRFKRDTGNGALSFKGCVSGDLGVSGPGCVDIDTATFGGAESGLDGVRSLALGRGGKLAYVATRGDASIARFKRNPNNGKLRFKGCISAFSNAGPGGSGACRSIPTDTGNTFADNSGMGAPESLVLSRDGKSLYVSAAQDAAVATFRRAKRTGKLTYKGCITGESGLGVCHEIGSAAATGFDSGLAFPQFMALSPDDKSLYVAVGQDDDVATFRRAR